MLLKLKKVTLGLVVFGLAMSGCSSSSKRESAESTASDRSSSQTAQASDSDARSGQRGDQAGQSAQGQVVQERSEIIGQSGVDFGGPSVSQGQVTVPVKRRITRTVISRNQIPSVRICEQKADVNRMSADNFMAIGFSQDAANRLVQQRDKQGRFNSLDELAQVQGVDRSLLEQLAPDLAIVRSQQAGQAD